MQILQGKVSWNVRSLLMRMIGLLLLTSNISYAFFMSHDQKKSKARELVAVLSLKYNQIFDEIPLYSNKESALELNLHKLGFDLNYADQITNQRLKADIDDLYAAASSLRPWNPFCSMDSSTLELHNEIIQCACKAEKIINPIQANYKFIKGYKIYHLYDRLPSRYDEIAFWIYNYYYSSYSSRMSALLSYEDSVMQHIQFIDSFCASDRAAYPYLYDKLRDLRVAIYTSIDILKNSYEYQDALHQKRLEEERIAEMQRIARERERQAAEERKWREIFDALEADKRMLEQYEQDLYNYQYNPYLYNLTVQQIAAESIRLQNEIYRLKLKIERDRLLLLMYKR